MFDFIAHMSIASITLVFILMPAFYLCVGALFSATEEKRTKEHVESVMRTKLTYSERKKYDERV